MDIGNIFLRREMSGIVGNCREMSGNVGKCREVVGECREMSAAPVGGTSKSGTQGPRKNRKNCRKMTKSGSL